MMLSCFVMVTLWLFFFKQKTAYEMRIRDWSSDVCSSDLAARRPAFGAEVGSAEQELARHRNRRLLVVGEARAGGDLYVVGHVPIGFAEQRPRARQIGRASCRARVCQYVTLSVVAVS